MTVEESKLTEAEERIQQQALRDEQLVTSLENKLSTLSKTVGDYERQHEQDKTTIQLSWLPRDVQDCCQSVYAPLGS